MEAPAGAVPRGRRRRRRRDAHRAFGRGWARHAHRLRQRREPAARARDGAQRRDGDPHGTRGVTSTTRQAAAHRELVLGLAAGTVGLGLAYYLVQGVRAAGAGIVPRLAELALDQTALLFTFGLSLTTSLVFGLAPALHAAKGGVAAAMTSLGRGSGGRTGARTRDALVVAQVAVSFVMLIVAGLLIRSLWQLQRVDPGFDPHGVFTAEIGLPEISYPVRATPNDSGPRSPTACGRSLVSRRPRARRCSRSVAAATPTSTSMAVRRRPTPTS